MTDSIKKIVESDGLIDLLDKVDEFCREFCVREDDAECMELVKALENCTGDLHTLLYSYVSICEDGDEVIDALYEFVCNCKGFAEAEEDMTKQVTSEEFEAVLEECEEKCSLVSCINKEHVFRVAEVPLVDFNILHEPKIKGNNIVVFLPRIDINADVRQYIAEKLGSILYDVVKTKIDPQTIINELHRYIPATRSDKSSVRALFKKYFNSVVKYKDRKPGIYPKFDEHMQNVLDMEFFKRIIVQYLKE